MIGKPTPVLKNDGGKLTSVRHQNSSLTTNVSPEISSCKAFLLLQSVVLLVRGKQHFLESKLLAGRNR